MEKIGIRELRLQASEIIRRVEAGETIEVTNRGRPVALLVQAAPSGLAQLEREGLVRRGEGDLLDVEPVPTPETVRPPSELVSEGRDE